MVDKTNNKSLNLNKTGVISKNSPPINNKEVFENVIEVDKVNEEESIRKVNQIKKQIEELNKTIQLLGKKTERAKSKTDFFKEPRDTFVFKFTKTDEKDNGENKEQKKEFIFDTQRFIVYTKGLVKKMFLKEFPDDKDGIKITKLRNFDSFFWFKTNKKITIGWLYTIAKGTPDKFPFKIIQYRTDNYFFEDFDDLV